MLTDGSKVYGCINKVLYIYINLNFCLIEIAKYKIINKENRFFFSTRTELIYLIFSFNRDNKKYNNWQREYNNGRK